MNMHLAMDIRSYHLPLFPFPFSLSFSGSFPRPSSAHSSSATISTGSAVVSMSRRTSFNRSTPMKCSAITRERSERTMRSPFRVTSPWLARISRAGSIVPTMLSLIRSRSASRPRQTTAFATYSSELCSRSCSGATSSEMPECPYCLVMVTVTR